MEGKEAQEQAGRRSKEGKGRSERGQLRKMQRREIIQERIRNVQLVSVPGNINHRGLEGDHTLLKET